MVKVTLKICFMGAARYFKQLDQTSLKKFRELEALGGTLVIGFSHDMRPRTFSEHARFYLLPRLPLPPLRYVEMLAVGSFLALWLIFRHDVQILVAQSPYEGFAAGMAKLVAGLFRRRVVLVVESHGDFEESLFLQRRILLPGFYRFLMRLAARFALDRADLLRAVSNSTRQQLERWSPGKAIYQFPAWTDIDVFLQAGRDREKGTSQDILYAGVLIPRKAIHHLINAFSRVSKDFPEARLTLVGREENMAYASALKEQVERLNLRDQVRFIGEVSQPRLAAWMSQARVFVLPSVSEGLGLVIVEAMASGTPVIGSNVGGIPEMVEDGATGFLVEPGDEDALAAKLRWMLEHPAEACLIGRKARDFAEQFVSTERYVQGYRRVFEAASALISEQAKHAHFVV